VPPRCEEDYEEFEEMVEEEVEEEEIELDKLVSVLRLAGKSPEPASPGPAAKKKTTRWVKKKVRRRKKETSEQQVRAPPLPHLHSNSRSNSPAASPALARKEPGALNKPPPPPPPVPDYPHEDLTKPLAERLAILHDLLAKSELVYDGFKVVDRELQLKIDALNQLITIRTKM